MSDNLKCQNHGGYSAQVRNVVCGLDCDKICAGYNSKCRNFIAVMPDKKSKVLDETN